MAPARHLSATGRPALPGGAAVEGPVFNTPITAPEGEEI